MKARVCALRPSAVIYFTSVSLLYLYRSLCCKGAMRKGKGAEPRCAYIYVSVEVCTGLCNKENIFLTINIIILNFYCHIFNT